MESARVKVFEPGVVERSTAVAAVAAPAPAAYRFEPGRPHPMGASADAAGVNFAVFSQHATGVQLLIFDPVDSLEPVQVIDLDSRVNKTFEIWHVYVHLLKPGVGYAYRVQGPADVHAGHRFDPDKVLLDPYAKGTSHTLWKRGDACGPGDNLKTSMRGVVVDTERVNNRRAGDPFAYDWEGDRPLRHSLRSTVVYEMHVGGFTRSPSSGAESPGTFDAVIGKVPYLKELGVTAVELLPVFAFDSTEIDKASPDGRPLSNYWGYSTVSYFAPHGRYCGSVASASAQVNEFRDMVKALHKEGIEVILDVVFNHTSEGNHQGPIISFKGFDNSVYYYLWAPDQMYYVDYSGCGNTINCNHPIVEKMILECVEY